MKYNHPSIHLKPTWLCIVIACLVIGFVIGQVSRKVKRCRTQHFESTKKVLSNWQTLYVGMSADEVTSIIGHPSYIERYPKVPAKHMSRSVYCTEVPKTKGFPMPLQIAITFCDNDTAMVRKEEPYCGKISTNGVPTIPVLLHPAKDELMSSCLSKTMDFRWTPSHGRSPIDYYIEISNCTFDVSFVYPKVHVPYACLPLPLEHGHFAWRVQARNNLGESAWSEWRPFICPDGMGGKN